MKKLIISLLILGFGISNVYAKSDLEAQNELRDVVVLDGAANLCANNIYTKCYNVSTTKCKSTIRPMLEQCFNKYKGQVTALSASAQLTQVRTQIGKCAGLKYDKALSKQADKKCLDKEISKLK